MIRAMETIYDVFRLLVSKARHTLLTDEEATAALAIIDQHDTAIKEQAGG